VDSIAVIGAHQVFLWVCGREKDIILKAIYRAEDNLAK